MAKKTTPWYIAVPIALVFGLVLISAVFPDFFEADEEQKQECNCHYWWVFIGGFVVAIIVVFVINWLLNYFDVGGMF